MTWLPPPPRSRERGDGADDRRAPRRRTGPRRCRVSFERLRSVPLVLGPWRTHRRRPVPAGLGPDALDCLPVVADRIPIPRKRQVSTGLGASLHLFQPRSGSRTDHGRRPLAVKGFLIGRDSLDAIQTRLSSVGRAEPHRNPAVDCGRPVRSCRPRAAGLVVATQNQDRLAVGPTAVGGGSCLPTVGNLRTLYMGEQPVRLLHLLVGPVWRAHWSGDHSEQRTRAARRWSPSGVDRPRSPTRRPLPTRCWFGSRPSTTSRNSGQLPSRC